MAEEIRKRPRRSKKSIEIELTEQNTGEATGESGGSGESGDTHSTPETTGRTETTDKIEVAEVPRIPLKRGRKKKSTDEIDFNDIVIKSSLESLLTIGFGFLSKSFGEHWNITSGEATAISDPLTRILKRLGLEKLDDKYIDYISLCTALGMVVVPRVLVEVNKPRGENEKNVEKGKISELNKRTIEPVQSVKKDIPSTTNVKSIIAELAI